MIDKEILNFDGQEVTFKRNEGYLFIYIDETFHSAGTIYGWSGYKEGIGVNKKIVNFAVKELATLVIGIRHHDVSYFIDALEWKEYCEFTNSIYKINDLISLYVFPLSKLQKQNVDKKKIVAYKQQKL